MDPPVQQGHSFRPHTQTHTDSLDIFRLGHSRRALFRHNQMRDAPPLSALRDLPPIPHPLLAHDRLRGVHGDGRVADQPLRVYAAVWGLGQ